jgi:DNA-binding response OmpR family regulator
MNLKSSRQKMQAADSRVPIILVVEDDKDNLLFISHTLIHLGYSFVTATEGQAAFDLALKYDIDLALVDLVLSDISGLELINNLRQNNLTKNMPIIAVSALVKEQYRDLALKSGCDDYLSKPYLIDDLKSKIDRFLQNRHNTKLIQSMECGSFGSYSLLSAFSRFFGSVCSTI